MTAELRGRSIAHDEYLRFADFTEGRISAVRRGVEGWVPDYHEAMACRNVDDRVRCLNEVLGILGEFDTAIQTAFCTGVPYDEEVAGMAPHLYELWHRAAVSVESAARLFEAAGYAVEGVAALRDGIRDVWAALNPCDYIDGGMVAILEKAVADHAAGLTEPMPVG